MLRLRFLLLAVFFSLPVWAQTSGFKVFGGYSLEHIATGCGSDYTCGTNDNLGRVTNLNGWALSGTAYYKGLGITTQLTGNYNGRTMPSFTSVRRLGIQFGPEYAIRLRRASVFAHALFGFMHQNSPTQTQVVYTNLDYTQFLWSVGGGLDIKVARLLWVRAGQIDFERHSVPVGIGGAQPSDGFRYSAGIVLKF